MPASLLKRLMAARAGGISRACRPLIALLCTTFLMVATGVYVSPAVQVGTPVASPSTPPAASPIASPAAIDRGPSTQIIVGEITIEITDEAILPVHFESVVGRDVTITIVNTGSRPHNFSIDELDVDVDLEPGETATIEIEQPRIDTYRYYSDLPGDEGLEGSMTVFI